MAVRVKFYWRKITKKPGTPIKLIEEIKRFPNILSAMEACTKAGNLCERTEILDDENLEPTEPS